ncbi:MAG: 3-phosphoshikimate 1-carboxyvinyltransferase [bacterium]
MSNNDKISFTPVERLEGTITIPGDKSISHRALFISALAGGVSKIDNLLIAEDILSTIRCLTSLGANIQLQDKTATIIGNTISGFSEPSDVLDAGNSGTTARILMGLLSTQNFFSVVTGDDSLRTRPMKRVTAPLTIMGASIDGREYANYLPVFVRGNKLKGIDYSMPAASAQVKTSLLIAAMGAKGTMTIREPIRTRDHTERMLKASGVDLKISDNVVQLTCNQKVLPLNIMIPGDFSSAAFFIGAGIIAKQSDIFIKNVGINPGRTGFIDILKLMGAKVEIINTRYEVGEPVADIHVKPAGLHGILIEDKELIVRAIDELPLVAVLSAYAEGETIIRNAGELRVKETDRIKAVVDGLSRIGIRARELQDGLVVEGGQVRGGTVSSYGDHRIAMSFAVASVSSEKGITVDNFNVVRISFPEFLDTFNTLRHT